MKKLSLEDIKDLCEKRNYILEEVYWDKKCYIILTDKIGYKYNMWIQNFKMGKDPFPFHKGNKFTLQNIKLWLSINNCSFEITENNFYNGTNSKLEFYCNICHNNFLSILSNITSGHGCGVCTKKQLVKENSLAHLFPNLIIEWDDSNNLSPFDVFSKTSKIVMWKCSTCGETWESSVVNRTNGKNGCPNCSFSKGEKKIVDILDKLEKKYKREYKFKDCKNINQLRFDFYMYDFNLCIEYQGIQHYESREFLGGESEFKRLKKRDKIKQDYCKNNNINLLIIPYWDFDNIESILIETLNSLEGR